MAKPELQLSMEEIETRYKGEWVLVRLSKIDETRNPLEGSVITHGRRKRVHDKLFRLVTAEMKTGDQPDLPYYIFSAGAFAPINKL